MKKNIFLVLGSLVGAVLLAKFVGGLYTKIFNVVPDSSFGVEPADTGSLIMGFIFSYLFLISLLAPFSTNWKKFLGFGVGWLILILVILTAWEVLIIGTILSLLGLGLGHLIKKTKK